MTAKHTEAEIQGKLYFLPSDNDERKRLVGQHNLILNGIGRKHIHAPVDLGSIGALLEIGTGTGIWLEEVAKQLPGTAEIIGVDISSNLFPLSPPSNVSFQQQSVLDLPKEWTNKFDFIHQRLLILALRSEQWPVALGEIYRVLKPGGWFQLYEIFGWENCGPAQARMNELQILMYESRGIYGFWGSEGTQWETFVKEAGFTNIQVTWHGWPMGKWAGEEGFLGGKCHLEYIKACKMPILGAGIVSGSEAFDELVEEVEKELESRDGMRNRCIMICGQKPMIFDE